MITVYKQELHMVDRQVIEVPHPAMFRHLGVQKGVPCIWYECDTEGPMVKVAIHCYGTGAPIKDENLRYLGSVLLYNDSLVLHYYLEE